MSLVGIFGVLQMERGMLRLRDHRGANEFIRGWESSANCCCYVDSLAPCKFCSISYCLLVSLILLFKALTKQPEGRARKIFHHTHARLRKVKTLHPLDDISVSNLNTQYSLASRDSILLYPYLTTSSGLNILRKFSFDI